MQFLSCLLSEQHECLYDDLTLHIIILALMQCAILG